MYVYPTVGIPYGVACLGCPVPWQPACGAQTMALPLWATTCTIRCPPPPACHHLTSPHLTSVIHVFRIPYSVSRIPYSVAAAPSSTSRKIRLSPLAPYSVHVRNTLLVPNTRLAIPDPQPPTRLRCSLPLLRLQSSSNSNPPCMPSSFRSLQPTSSRSIRCGMIAYSELPTSSAVSSGVQCALQLH